MEECTVGFGVQVCALCGGFGSRLLEDSSHETYRGDVRRCVEHPMCLPGTKKVPKTLTPRLGFRV